MDRRICSLNKPAFSIAIIMKMSSPHIIKFQSAPCQKPVNIQTIKRLRRVLALPWRLPPRGIYTYSLNHEPKVLCHLRQNSVIERDVYGLLKFAGNVKPIIFPSPIAIREYPQKSKYIWKE